ncbi:thiamine-phosphate kinase [Limnothrix sp. FACHB-881]|uniref:thiamine-phosphate kinase n=1 Tax=Limnothrix sp. FACHB-881 TaxID=2692819 RepID=UPI0016858364|nr:thiamine-phosphate kinase [Limnothrix sp. FACHB-881]MBD2636185.1 thiamine-phosphate kinase [Limnothrix sp. FACHB-881]
MDAVESLRLADVGEAGLLARLFTFCDRSVVGDDAALLDWPEGRSLVVTTDVLVDGVHFSDRTTPPRSIGWRAVAANLSDLAAMGAMPRAITVGLSLPGNCAIDWVESLYGGMADCLAQFGGAIVGGDVTRSTVATVAITAIGSVLPDRSLQRHAAQPGDAIVVTGEHGASRAGLALLLADWPPEAAEPSAAARSAWIRAHQYPTPRLDVIAQLIQLIQLRPRLADRPLAAMDSSDGLADAVVQLAQASGLRAKLQGDRLPIPSGLVAAVGLARARHWTLYGGEDFELVLCLPPDLAADLVQSLGGSAAIVGEMVAPEADLEALTQQPIAWVVDSGAIEPIGRSASFQHFGTSATTGPA